jgi:hypothetical protein
LHEYFFHESFEILAHEIDVGFEKIQHGGSNTESSATTLLPEQAKPSRSIKRMVLPIRQFYLGLALAESAQVGVIQFCKSQVGGSIPLASFIQVNLQSKGFEGVPLVRSVPFLLINSPFQYGQEHGQSL